MSVPTSPLSNGADSAPSSERDDTMRGILAIALLISLLYVVTLFSLWKSYLEGEMQGAVITLLGGGALLSAVGWYFGSSSGAKSQLAQKEKQ